VYERDRIARPAVLRRRSALGLLGASLATTLAAGTAPAHRPSAASEPVAPLPASVRSGSLRAPVLPEGTGARSRLAGFTPDFQLPPIHNGLAPVITKIQTKLPVVFLTIDDGVTKTPEMVRLLAEYDYPVSIFLAKDFVTDRPAFFKNFIARGSLVENHTVHHNINMVTQMGYAQQLAELNAMQDFAQQQFGRRPTLFRPPGGAYSLAMRQAVAAAGMKAIITWEAKANAGHMDYQYGKVLRPGEIVLMHFRPCGNVSAGT
jgi:peptidoglycan/xylan/chitin deacetylase (PgdA/CDA1 family)